MAHIHRALHEDHFPCPDHFVLERHHPVAIAAWAVGLVLALVLIGMLASQLRMTAQAKTYDQAQPTTTATIR